MPTPLEAYNQKVNSGDLRPDESQLEAMQELQRLYDDLTQTRHPERQRRIFKRFFVPLRMKEERIKGIYLWGGVGRGKSMVMDLFFHCLPETMPKRRVHFHRFMIETHDYLHKARQEKDSEAAILKYADKVADEAKVLCFDEFHVTDIADAMILSRLFSAILKHDVALVATSNWPPDRLYEGGLQRELFLPFIELVKSRMVIIEMNGAIDYRLQCLSDTGVYFSPLGPAADKKANAVFDRLTDNAEPYDETLTVKGRNLYIDTVAKGVARFSFDQLCARALGAEDYLSIAKNYHTVFIENIPKLKDADRNEAKRLMTLIDALYDSGTKLIITADAPPEKLYKGDDHSFEFQRTISRLVEMQSQEYLGR